MTRKIVKVPNPGKLSSHLVVSVTDHRTQNRDGHGARFACWRGDEDAPPIRITDPLRPLPLPQAVLRQELMGILKQNRILVVHDPVDGVEPGDPEARGPMRVLICPSRRRAPTPWGRGGSDRSFPPTFWPLFSLLLEFMQASISRPPVHPTANSPNAPNQSVSCIGLCPATCGPSSPAARAASAWTSSSTPAAATIPSRSRKETR